MRTDNQKLASIIELCFDYSSNDRVSEEDQKKFLALGKRLRGTLLNLITAEFEADTAQVIEANSQIESVNNKLRNEAQVLDDIANTIEQLGRLASILDDLIGIAAIFR
ncbi:MAG: hypothetical protein ACYS0C_02310 [Planctomycetota bacterium]|jgi:hypothetical protein